MVALGMVSLLIGLAAGVVAGSLGVGGGIVIVPALLVVFQFQEVNPAVVMPLAVGTSLATIVVTNAWATWLHHRRQGVVWRMVGRYAPGILLGAWLGAMAAVGMTGRSLRVLFGIFELAVGIWMMVSVRTERAVNRRCPWSIHLVLSVIFGWISAMFGIGGGTLTVPALTWLDGLTMRQGVGTASAIGWAIAVFGVAGYLSAGWGDPRLPRGALGFVHGLAFVGIIVGTLLTTPAGVRLAHAIAQERLRQGFALFLILVGVRLVLP